LGAERVDDLLHRHPALLAGCSQLLAERGSLFWGGWHQGSHLAG